MGVPDFCRVRREPCAEQMVKWNRDFSYVIGLFTADGNISSDGRHLEFCSKDLELVKSIKKCFNLNNKISRKQHKSKSLTYLEIPKEYFCDFLRGLIDGDGTIDYFMHPESREKQFRIRIASASKNFLEWLSREINKFLDMKGAIRQVVRAYQLCHYKKDSIRLVDFMCYSGNINFLSRKFEIAKLMKARTWRNWDTRTA